jgi:predicted MFS family arabinose efflux permease
LKVNASQLGELVSAYTFAGMFGALAYSRYADRWDKRHALCWLMSGLALGTLLCGVAQGYGHLMAARILAGMMSGPAGATVVAIVSDLVPEERRGRAMGIVFGGFTAASVIGLPVSIALANWAGWRKPFIGLAMLAMAIIPLVWLKLPPSPRRKPVDHAAKRSSLYHQGAVWLAWACMAALMIADFAFVPYMPTFLTGNLGLAKADLAYVYAAGGLTTLVTFQYAGKLTDRLGTYPVYLVSSLAAVLVVGFVFLKAPSPAPLGLAMALLAAIFFVNAPRVLSAMTLFTKAPHESQRGEFLSLQNVVQQGAVGLGSLLAAHLISGEAGGRIEHAGRLAMQNGAGIVLGLILVWKLDRMLAKPRP